MKKLLAYIIGVLVFRQFPCMSRYGHGRLFSLFHVIAFPNDECTDQATGDKGVCFTASECDSMANSRRGSNCASGFGICCLIRLNSCPSNVVNNCSYVLNPDYPAHTNSLSICDVTLKGKSDVCHFRLDFEAFSLRNANLAELGDCNLDWMSVNSGSGRNPPVICGQNRGLHMYVESDKSGKLDSTIRFRMTGSTFNRKWKIKVSQITCGETSSPPADCLMYFTGISGTVKSYNYEQTISDDFFHLNNQDYRICIRQEKGFCSIRYNPSDEPFSFKLFGRHSGTGHISSLRGLAGSGDVQKDYIVIPNAHNGDYRCSVDRVTPIAVATVDRLSGAEFTCISGSRVSTPLYSSTTPFGIHVNFEVADSLLPNQNRGFSLDYQQIAC